MIAMDYLFVKRKVHQPERRRACIGVIDKEHEPAIAFSRYLIRRISQD